MSAPSNFIAGSCNLTKVNCNHCQWHFLLVFLSFTSTADGVAVAASLEGLLIPSIGLSEIGVDVMGNGVLLRVVESSLVYINIFLLFCMQYFGVLYIIYYIFPTTHFSSHIFLSQGCTVSQLSSFLISHI